MYLPFITSFQNFAALDVGTHTNSSVGHSGRLVFATLIMGDTKSYLV
jgi:hypothetical protein